MSDDILKRPPTVHDHARDLRVQLGGVYKHTKSGEKYRVLGLARLEHRPEIIVVVYQSIADPKSLPWIRPVDEFHERFTA